ncbi:hypothetical protein N7453_006665 [Penicillium expansum]|nr:hypothetical protein N7453_006665 [Penicillium expansum]
MSSASMDGQQGLFEALIYLPHWSKPDVLRLDQAIPSPLPELDDISDGARVGNVFFGIRRDSRSLPGRTPLRRVYPLLTAGVGEILARIWIEIPGAKFQAGQDQVLGDVDLHDCCISCGYYRKRVAFHVASLEERFSINIANGTYCEKNGGFPKPAQEFLDAQQAFAHFGRADHLTPSWPPVRHCYCACEAKRTIRLVEPASRQKRRRHE